MFDFVGKSAHLEDNRIYDEMGGTYTEVRYLSTRETLQRSQYTDSPERRSVVLAFIVQPVNIFRSRGFQTAP